MSEENFIRINTELKQGMYTILNKPYPMAVCVLTVWSTMPVGDYAFGNVSDMVDVSTINLPRKGEVFICRICGMSLAITEDCKCRMRSCAILRCCGQELSRP